VTEPVEQLLAKRDILDPAFKRHLNSLSSAEAKAAEIEYAIRHEIHVHRDENPTAYTSLWEQLEKIVNEKRAARVSAASTLARLEDIAAQVSSVRAGGSGLSSSLTGTAGAILPFIDGAVAAEVRAVAAADVAKALDGYAVVVDWQQKEDVQRQMRRAIKERLRPLGMEAGKIEAITAKVMDVARARLVR
jgi:type I restriction enzyme R subunit